jgi:protein-tyrosine kinase
VKSMIRNCTILKTLEKLTQEKATGVLSLRKGNETISVLLYDGFIEGVGSTEQERSLGHFLVKFESVDEAALTGLRKKADRRKRPLGEIAISSKQLQTRELRMILHRQAIEVFQHALTERFDDGGFQPSEVSYQYPLRMSFGQLMLELARLNSVPLGVSAEVAVSLKDPNVVASLNWRPREISVLRRLYGRRRISHLVSELRLDEEEVRETLGVLLEMELIELHDAGQAPTTSLVHHDSIPVVPEVPFALFEDRLEILRSNHSYVNEQLKALKVRLNEMKQEHHLRIINVSSPYTEDGKSLIASSLALCFAEDPGQKTLLIDCDLRAPTVHDKIGIELGPGLVQYLLDSRALEPHCFIRKVQDLYVMTAGQQAENPISLFSLSRMKDLLNIVKRDFDTVILDSPPYLPIADARMLSNLADGTIMVVRQRKTPFESLQKSLQAVDKRKFLGVVLNDVQVGRFDNNQSYGSYYYGYGTLYPEIVDSKRGSKVKKIDTLSLLE